jgi:hypothetical protein
MSSIRNRFIDLVLAPLNYPDIIPFVLPLIVGAVVMELYFGKHENEELGWNTSVGNAVIWFTTGATIYLTTELSQNETIAIGALMSAGVLMGYLNFYHKWRPGAAFRISSSGFIYTGAYIISVLTKTSIPVNTLTAKASGTFVISTIAGFKLLQSFETPQQPEFEV